MSFIHSSNPNDISSLIDDPLTEMLRKLSMEMDGSTGAKLLMDSLKMMGDRLSKSKDTSGGNAAADSSANITTEQSAPLY